MSMSITRRKERKAVRTGTSIVVRHLLGIALMWAPGLVHGQTLTLQQAIEAAEANNRAIHAARLERAKALTEVNVARTYRLPAFSVAALGSQSLANLGLTFPQGSLGVYPGTGPIPGKSTKLSVLSVSLRKEVGGPISGRNRPGFGVPKCARPRAGGRSPLWRRQRDGVSGSSAACAAAVAGRPRRWPF